MLDPVNVRRVRWYNRVYSRAGKASIREKRLDYFCLTHGFVSSYQFWAFMQSRRIQLGE